MGYAYVKGEFLDEHEASISLSERAFLYGDALFETIRISGGVALFPDDHLARLHRSAVELGFLHDRFREEFVYHLGKVIAELLRRSGYSEAKMRIELTRGEGSRSPRPPEVGGANLYANVTPLSVDRVERLGKGVTAVICSFPRNQHSPTVKHKTASYLESILALKEADESEVDEAIICNLEGRVAEGATSNIFLITGETVITPPVSEGLLPGVTRGLILNLAQALEIPTQERTVRIDDLWSCSEAFMTNAINGIMPLLEVDGRPVGLGGGIGPLTEQLQLSYQQIIDHFIMGR